MTDGPRGGGGFAGTERFAIRRELGRGAFGVVYEALDRELGTTVALKTLERTEPNALYRFKREFRELAGVSDPHLVTLYELLSADGRWFFTMELVEGVDFLSWIRRDASPGEPFEDSGHLVGVTAATFDGAGETVEIADDAHSQGARAASAAELTRLRIAALQLAEGVAALHRARKLHRDLKPSNVTVRSNGEVVLLDFGLVLSMQPGERARDRIVGTPSYMAPEQAAGREVGPASDWYSVGVMLFQALTGVVPFQGLGTRAILDLKQQRDGPSPSSIVAGIDPDLDELCTQLLRRDATARPDGREVLRRLGGTAYVSAAGAPSADAADTFDRALPFVGRDAELERLHGAYAQTQRGVPVVALIHGRSGIGKSRLLARAVDAIVAEERTAVVVSGRCYQQESVPFEGLDSVVDAISRFLAEVPRAEAQAYLPRDVHALTRLFPVLGRVDVIAETEQRGVVAADDGELRRRAHAALRELLGRIAARRPLVVTIDDLQWGGEDTAALLVELISPPDPPSMLFVGTCRQEEAASSPLLERLARALAELPDVPREEIILEPLDERQARALAAELLDGAPEIAARIADDSEGSPFLVCELARHYAESSPAEPGVAGVGDVVLQRVAKLDSAPRRLLELVAVAGRPIARSVAVAAADVGDASAAAVAQLRAAHLIRLRDTDDGELVETYHDRIRHAVAGAVEREVRVGYHRRAAEVLERTGGALPEHLMQHWIGAGEGARAAPLAAAAAANAAATLAFERAVEQYRVALELGAWDDDERCQLETAMAAAMASAGQGTRAGLSYLRAAELAQGDGQRQELTRRAAEQLLLSGRIDKGTDVLGQALAPLGLDIPRSRRRALAQLLWLDARLRMRRMRYQPRDESEVDPSMLQRIDACWTAGHGLAGVSPVTSICFMARAALLSLRAGEPRRVAATNGFYAAMMSSVSSRSIEPALAIAREAAERSGDPYALNLMIAVRGAAAYFRGDLEATLRWCDRAAAALAEECQNAAWEIQTAEYLANFALNRMGQWAECEARVVRQVQRAEQRGDLYAAATHELSVGYYRYLVADDDASAEETIDSYVARWSQKEMHYQHFYEVLSRSRVLTYRGQPLRAFEFVDQRWADLRRAGHFRVRVTHSLCLMLRAEHAISAAYRQPAERDRLLAIAEADIKKLARVSYGGAAAKARQLRACLAIARTGVDDGALRELARANGELEAASLGPDWAIGERLRGRLLGGDEGTAVAARGTAFLAAQGVRSIERISRLRCPGPPA